MRVKQKDQPADARSLDLGLRFLGHVVQLQYGGVCAVCRQWVTRGSMALEASHGAIAHRACGEPYGASK
jgi:hypothetical protein